jgi:hypothetical protein
MSLPPVFPTAFYRLLAKGAQQLGVSRTRLATDALRHYLKAQTKKNSPLRQVLPDDLAEQFAEARRKMAEEWWSNLDEKEKTERGRKAARARWGNK